MASSGGTWLLRVSDVSFLASLLSAALLMAAGLAEPFGVVDFLLTENVLLPRLRRWAGNLPRSKSGGNSSPVGKSDSGGS